MTNNFNLCFSQASTFLITNMLASKVGLPRSFLSFLQKRTICLSCGRHGWKNHHQIKGTALKQNKKKRLHAGKEPEAH
jgi:hypothetical protein